MLGLSPGRVVSGGQAGGDEASLVAAARSCIPTGGRMPRGFLVRDGARDVPRPDLAARFGLREHPSAAYADRTAQNVRDANGTLRFAFDRDVPGERCTLKRLRRLGRPYLDIDPRAPIPPERAAAWVREHRVATLNVASNVEPKPPKA